jgi:hypothetical protein
VLPGYANRIRCLDTQLVSVAWKWIPQFGLPDNMSHCSLLRVVRPEQPNSISPFSTRDALTTSLTCGLVPISSAVIILELPHPLSNRHIRSLLRPARPERFSNQLTANLSHHSRPNSPLPSQSLFQDNYPIFLQFFFSLTHNGGTVIHVEAGATMFPAHTPCAATFYVSEEVYLSTGSISLFFVT